VQGKPLLEVRNLSKAFKGVQALDGVSLQVREGEILGLLGPERLRQVHVINVVSGHYPLSAGEILFDGRDLTGAAAHRMAHAGIARTYQIPRPFAHMTVLQNVSMVAMFGCASLGRARRCARPGNGSSSPACRGARDALPRPEPAPAQVPGTGAALAARPRLVLLDEVLSGLTPGEINEAIELIRRSATRAPPSSSWST
jgi:branched-chain amino acid transport system permease protein